MFASCPNVMCGGILFIYWICYYWINVPYQLISRSGL